MAKFEVASRGLFVLTFAICYDFAFLFQEKHQDWHLQKQQNLGIIFVYCSQFA